jgi:hypothetical protein
MENLIYRGNSSQLLKKNNPELLSEFLRQYELESQITKKYQAKRDILDQRIRPIGNQTLEQVPQQLQKRINSQTKFSIHSKFGASLQRQKKLRRNIQYPDSNSRNSQIGNSIKHNASVSSEEDDVLTYADKSNTNEQRVRIKHQMNLIQQIKNRAITSQLKIHHYYGETLKPKN